MTLEEYLPAGTYWLQFTRGFQTRTDMQGSVEETWKIATNFNPDLDIDRDGHQRPSDCDDFAATVHPGSEEIFDNGVDENCDGVDARRDSDGDSVPDYQDHCVLRSSAGVDADRNGCPDPQKLPLVAQIRLTLRQGQLRMTAMSVLTAPGARVAISCNRRACARRAKTAGKERLQFADQFDGRIPEGSIVTVSATKPGLIGVRKRYRLSIAGVKLLKETDLSGARGSAARGRSR